jgi:hypothetical protein
VIPEDIWRAYASTLFRATVVGHDIRIRVGDVDPNLDDVLDARGATTWAYITAWNPQSRLLTRGENDWNQQSLRADLERAGFAVFEGHGEPPDANWEPEASLLVLGIEEADALALGAKYGQLAIVTGRRHCPARLVACQ